MKTCEKGYHVSLNDTHRRCVKNINRSECNKIHKEFSSQTRKCRKPCKKNEERIIRKDGRGTRCRLICKPNQERGKRYCRVKCGINQKRVARRDKNGSRCVNK